MSRPDNREEREEIYYLTKRNGLQSRSINMHDDIIWKLKIQRAHLPKMRRIELSCRIMNLDSMCSTD